MAKVLLIGAGGIGRHHLGSLVGSSAEKITVLDTSEESLSMARSRVSESGAHDCHVDFVSDYSSISDSEFDLAIIATPSSKRVSIALDILARFKIKNLILEKLLAPNFGELLEYEKVLETGVSSWVNCPRRLYPYNIQIHDEIDSSKGIYMSVEGGGWGMASNSIHMIDLFTYLAGEPVEECSSRGGPVIKDSKHRGYKEFFGELELTSQNSRLRVKCHEEIKPVCIIVETSTSTFIYQEQNQSLMKSEFNSEHKFSTSEIRVPYQSELTSLYLEKILKDGSPGLPTLSESLNQHKVFLKFVGKLDSEAKFT